MNQVADRISQVTPSMTLTITAQAKRMREEGQEVYSFGAGEPDFDTPDFIKMAAIDALNAGKTKYTPSSGITELREAIAEKFMVENQLITDPSQVIVSSGAKQSLFFALTAICDPGDEVIIPSPYWTSYVEMVRIAGAKPVIIQTRMEDGWKLRPEDFDSQMTGRTKAIILNTPANPTGSVYTREELAALGEIAAAEEIVIISDEIYEKLIYNGKEHVSIASLSDELRELTITINGFSKAYSMTGWRLGYLSAPADIANAIDTIQSHCASNPTSFAQYGGLAAITAPQEFVDDMRDEFDMRRKYMLNRLKSMGNNLRIVEPDGAFYFLVDTEPMQIKSTNLAEKLLSRYQVAAIPGIAFGHDYSIRLSYAVGLEVISEGLDRLEDFVRSH